MAQQQLNVCVIGAGLSGLVTIKELLDENHQVTCFEKGARIGGVFNYPTGIAYDAMKLTVSNYFMSFSSFPPPEEQERYFWTRKEYMDYLNRFSDEFGLVPHIQLEAEVTGIRPAGDDGYDVTVERNGQTETLRFDAVAVCQGAFRNETPRIPSFKGAESFSGQIIHAADYRDAAPFAGKRVVCVGMGETSADVTAQIAEVAEACWLSFRRYPVLVERYPGGGTETGDANTTRLSSWIPRAHFNTLRMREEADAYRSRRTTGDARWRLINTWLRKAEYPGHRPLQKNDSFVDSVLSGKMEIVPSAVDELSGDTVRFADGTMVTADVIMCCTGYEESSIPESWFEGVKINDVRGLYKHAFHPDLGSRVVFIGWTRPQQGGVPGLSEMLARYFSLLCSGKRELPPRNELVALINSDRAKENMEFYGAPKMRTLVNYTDHMDQLAELIGCKPRLADHEDDPELYLKLLAGSNIALCYRLRGPHSMPDLARKVITRLNIAQQDRDIVWGGIEHITQFKSEELPGRQRLREIFERAYAVMDAKSASSPQRKTR